ncbi:MAG: O-antigen ligase family protein [Phenylobacterium sp.]|uniref:O-antigen ligase family protein n=1 Tax=Phenylobacterium sp. TaxID=1871053 RepID=UPI0027362C1E|nr:O-antigen ligase family protein [Phenylobacterium sp.]MDP3173561.1 O-antigen ligase family protein [Phenylobacterium sp.]
MSFDASPDEAAARDHFQIAAIVLLAVAMILGGSSTDPLSAGIVRFIASPVLAFSLWRLSRRPLGAVPLSGLLLLALGAGLTLLQLIPLPPEVWSALPQRAIVVEGYRAAGMTLPWAPLSLTPDRTLNAGLALLPPAAMFCAALSLSAAARRRLAIAAMILAAASIALGMAQLAGGATSPLRFQQPANLDAAVGFFANRNHQAVLLVAAIPLAALLVSQGRGAARGSNLFWMLAAVGVVLILVVGLSVSKSRAGVILLAPAAIGALMVAWPRARRMTQGGTPHGLPALGMLAAIAGGVALVVLFNLTPLADRFNARVDKDTRWEVAPIVAQLGADYGPLGSGLGSFRAVYEVHEAPERVTPTYINHAHDDFLEIWLEAGWPGVALIAAFLVWWICATLAALRGGRGQGISMALAGSTVIGLLLAHSVADYPLRTPALATLFALACAMVAGAVPPRLREA